MFLRARKNEKYENAHKMFLRVRNFLLEEADNDAYCLSAKAYRLCYYLPLKFYLDKTLEQCVKEIKEMSI